MHMNTGVVGMGGVVICAAIFLTRAVFVKKKIHTTQLTDYCNTLNKKMFGVEKRVVHVCGEII